MSNRPPHRRTLTLHPPLDSDAPGAATRGAIVRILVLPGYAAEAAEDFGFTRGWVQGFESSGESNLLGEQMSPGHGEVKA